MYWNTPVCTYNILQRTNNKKLTINMIVLAQFFPLKENKFWISHTTLACIFFDQQNKIRHQKPARNTVRTVPYSFYVSVGVGAPS